MSNRLRMYHIIFRSVCKVLDTLRVTRQRNLARMVTGIYLGQHVHLSKIANHLRGASQLTSKVKRLRRFVANKMVDVRANYTLYAQTVIEAAAASERLRLLIDTTELPGTRHILMVAIAYSRRSIPLIWKLLRSTSVTDSDTQRNPLEALASWLPDKITPVLIGDGEFHSIDLMAWLQEEGGHFRPRLHKDTFVLLPHGAWIQPQDIDIRPGKGRYLQQVYLSQGKYGPVNLAITWNPDEDEPWYIVTDQVADYYTLVGYSRRMWIEEMFGDFKDGRFHLQKSRLWQPERLSRLLLALCIAYTWLIHLGAYLIKERGWRYLVDRTDRRDRSLPNLACLWLQRCLNTDECIMSASDPIPGAKCTVAGARTKKTKVPVPGRPV